MIRALVSATMVLCAALPAWAQQGRISRTDCSRLVQHRPSADVAYQPGVDARGRPVAPADLSGGVQVQPRTEFTIDIEVDLQRRFGVPANANLYQPKAKVGSITVKGDKAYFDGQPLTDQTQDALAAYCAAELKK